MSKPDLAGSGIGKSPEAARVRRVQMHKRSLAKAESELEALRNPHTFDAEAKVERIKSDLAKTLAEPDASKFIPLEEKRNLKHWFRRVREDLTERRGASKDRRPPAYRAFEFIYRVWREKGEPPDGVEIAEERIAKSAGVTTDYVRRLFRDQLKPHIEKTKAGRRTTRYRPKRP